MIEYYKCRKCGGSIFTVVTEAPPNRPFAFVSCRRKGCDEVAEAPSLTAAFQKISEKPDAKDPAPPQDA